MPELRRIDLRKRTDCEHPDIEEKKSYLAKIAMVGSDDWYAGTFSRQWYGWSFNSVYMAGLQLGGGFRELYEIVETCDGCGLPLEDHYQGNRCPSE